MVRRWTEVGLAFGLLGTAVLSTCGSVRAQTPRVTANDKGADENGNAKPAVEKSSASVEPVGDLDDRENSVGLHLLKNIAEDQKALWIGAKHLRFVDADWLVPLGGATAAMLTTDTDYSKHLSTSPSRLSRSQDISEYGLGSMVSITGGMYLWGKLTHDDHKQETGILAGEAAIDSLAAVYALKYAFGRQRPLTNNYRGNFGSDGDSFPSGHAALTWSMASVIAHEYPGPLTSLLAYGLASAVSASRITSKQHFPSDVLIGSAIGWLEGMYVYRKHHDPRIGGGEWETYAEAHDSHERGTGNFGSPYVPLDSWIYPAVERVIAQGYINDAIVGMRPWTRLECWRLADEAREKMFADATVPSEAQELMLRLEGEFSAEHETLGDKDNRQFRVESVYARVTEVSGQPLSDGNHFGQTILNDFGRPYQAGFNSVDGFSTWTTSGRWVGYIRGEYQHTGSAPAQSIEARQFTASVDNIPGVPPAAPYGFVDRFRLLDAYIGLNFENWQLSFGKQSLWWGPMLGGPFMFSNNAEPPNIFRISRVSPFRLPSFLGWLGAVRVEWFLGQLAGHEFVFRTDTGILGQFGRAISRQPFIQGQKVSFKLSRNFEFSVSTTTVFSGGPTPLTWHYFLKSYSLNNGTSTKQGSTSDPGDRRSGIDFTYKVPGLRKWLTFYGEAFTEDEFSPLGYPRKSAVTAGIYLPRIPRLPKLDLRLEGGSTVPPDFQECLGCFYVNNRYPSGSYTNNGNLIGSWLGRASQGEQGWLTYWLSSRNKIQVNYRHQKISADYLPQGGTVNDGGVKADFWLGSKLMLSGSVQYEKWNYPLLNTVPRSNVTTSLGLSFWPRFRTSFGLQSGLEGIQQEAK